MTSVPENISAKGKVYPSALAALEGIADGASVLVAGWCGSGEPEKLLRGLAETEVSGLTQDGGGVPRQADGVEGLV